MTSQVVLLLWFHLVTALLASTLLGTFYVRARPRAWFPVWRELLLLNLLIPFLGAFLISPLLAIFHLFPHRPKRSGCRDRAFALEPTAPSAGGRQPLLKPLLALDLSEEELIALLNSLTPLNAPEETRLLRKVAHDHPSPTVRLVAVQILNQERQDRLSWIERLERGLRRVSGRRRAWLYGQIGWLCYRLAYLELVEREERQRFLELAESNLQLACMIEADQAAFWWTSAEVARLRGDLKAFQERLDWAQRLGMSACFLWFPALEGAQASGDWGRLKPLLSESNWSILPWVRLWQGEASSRSS